MRRGNVFFLLNREFPPTKVIIHINAIVCACVLGVFDGLLITRLIITLYKAPI